MTLKTLVTSFTAGAAAAATLGAAAVGVTSIAVGAGTAAASPVALAPLPAAPAPELQGALVSTLSALSGPGSFAGGKASYVQGGLGRIEARVADSGYNNAAAKGYFPLSFTVADIDQNGPVVTANVTAAAPTGAVATQPLTFIAGPSPTGWQLSKQSAMALMSAVG
ncbi:MULTISPECIES: hypothetical protein [Mycolicibacterium]|uniref:Low molecular weight antigen CFP2 (Low molecular weight protein antigen 2) (CFP-2) n=2 Tax=Mycolicibacterium TaxID=1866885 RepID=A1TAQ4_MYCVP|nr:MULTISPECIES: hypothetical protein [Mycolicibacterium]ABM14254.1 low molecular weight antigen CFP2 (low molecular weight protein antigen 2) (CFP-2) [Mycolicibacterium vanbaalenii PYR-1]MCV7128863.1 hypothetical protein [Mycolicibacterium vanbaalenii PYR-1]MDN4519922.1 hypothetical protein [Mycolicibacterium austroafricanum]MDW5613114.1 hypothetical protein [Mycolicibacterium sp. D5.8-2]PQP38958.1 hypothetical protein C6A88_34380 [Mycolicibacterium austroafricanum]